MKSVAAFLVLSSLFFGGENEVWKFKVNAAKLESCVFSGTFPCIRLDREVTMLIFQPGDVLEMTPTHTDSELAGVLITIKHHYQDTSRLTDPVSLKDQPDDVVCSIYAQWQKTCYQSYGAINTSVIVRPDTAIDIMSFYRGRTPIFLLTISRQDVELIEE